MHGDEARRVEALEAQFVGARRVAQRRRDLFAISAVRRIDHDRAAVGEGQRGRGGDHDHVDVTAEEVVHRLAGAGIRHVDRVDAGLLKQVGRAQKLGVGAANRQLFATGCGVFHEAFPGRPVLALGCDERRLHDGVIGCNFHRFRIERRLAFEQCGYNRGRARQQDGMAVGTLVFHVLPADGACSAAAVLDVPAVVHYVEGNRRHYPRPPVGAAAGAERHDGLYGFRRVIGCDSGQRAKRDCASGQCRRGHLYEFHARVLPGLCAG